MHQELNLDTREALAFSAQLEEAGRHDEAEKVLRAIIQTEPRNKQAYCRLGGVLFNRGDRFQALYCFERALKIDPKYSVALSNRGMTLCELGHLDEAEADLQRAVRLDPENAIPWNNLSNTLERAGQLEAALSAIERAAALAPRHALSHLNRGTVLGRLGHHAQAVAAFDAAIALDPEIQDARYNRAIGLLALGRYEEGFREYEWRFRSSEKIYACPSTAPRWTGENLAGKTILLWGEQGLGDVIQFMRYASNLREVTRAPKFAPTRILLYVQTALRSLCAEDGFEIVESDKALPSHDFQCPLMSLPTIFARIPPPWRAPVLGPSDCHTFGALLGGDTALRVGLCWSGNPLHRNDRNRSIPLFMFCPLLDVPGITLYSLQKDVRSSDQQNTLPEGLDGRTVFVDLAAHLTDMRQTATAIGVLDVVITVDTAVAHLAASLGAETWVLVPEVCDWRWAFDPSPWYPEAKIFRRQNKDWAPMIEMIRRRLEARARAAAA